MIACILLGVLVGGCGGGGSGKKVTAKPVVTNNDPPPPPPPETAEDREAKRIAAAHAIIPEGSTCLPLALKEAQAPRLELTAVGKDAVICALDSDPERLLGQIGCWTVNLDSGSLTYRKAEPLPGRGTARKLHDRCARGFCLPEDSKAAGDATAHLAWSTEGGKVAMLVGDEVHIYDAASKARESGFSIRGEKGVPNEPARLHWIGALIFIEGVDQGPSSPVWMFKPDGTAMGPIIPMGARNKQPASTHLGSFAMFDNNRVAIAEHGFSVVHTYETDSGKRAKLVRRIPKSPCKAAETKSFWNEAEPSLSERCKKHMAKTFGPLIGADAVAGSKSLLVLLRGERLGQLAVLDARTLAEKKAIRMPWCEAGEGGSASAAGGDAGASEQ